MKTKVATLTGAVAGALLTALLWGAYQPPTVLAQAGGQHFKCYRFGAPGPGIPVLLQDQFGEDIHNVGRSEFLCTPALKIPLR
jgi:hypothetical protein